jgi:hypothetical protein
MIFASMAWRGDCLAATIQAGLALVGDLIEFINSEVTTGFNFAWS